MVVARGLVGLFLILPAGCVPQGQSFLSPGGPVAAAERTHLLNVTAIMLVVVLPVLILAPLIAWRFRLGNRKARYTPDWCYSRPLEIAMWGIPALIVLALGWQLVRHTEALDPYQPIGAAAPLRVQVVGLDWKWLFIYPDLGIASTGEMAFPAGQPVSMQLTSDTVMQSFFIGALASQIYAMPGMETRLNLLADQPGTFQGENTQFNGLGFQHQKFAARAMAPDAFAAWVDGVRKVGIALDAKSYAQLALPSTPDDAARTLGGPGMPAGVVWFGAVAPDMFDGVLHRYMSGRPLAPQDQPGAPAFAATPAPAHH